MKLIIIVLRAESNILKKSYGVPIASIESEQQDGIEVRKQIRKGSDFNT
jgi:hypothetical protein